MDDSSDCKRAVKLALEAQVTGQQAVVERRSVRSRNPQARKDRNQGGNQKATGHPPEMQAQEEAEDEQKPPPAYGGNYGTSNANQHLSKANDTNAADTGGVNADDNESVESASSSSDALPLILKHLPRRGGGEPKQVEQVLPSTPLRRSMPLNSLAIPGAFFVGPSHESTSDPSFDSESEVDDQFSEQDDEAASPLDAYLVEGSSRELAPPPAPKPAKVYRRSCSSETTKAKTQSSVSCSPSFRSESLPPTIVIAEPECDSEDTKDADQRQFECKKMRCRLVDCLGLVGLLAVLIVMSALLAVTERPNDEMDLEDLSSHNDAMIQSSYQRFSPTLERIKDEGIFKCAPKPTPMGSSLCHIIAAAIFGDSYSPDRVQEFNQSGDEQLVGLANGEYDVVTRGFTADMDREVCETGLSFTIPVYFVGTQVAGDPLHVRCVEDGFHHLDECSDLRICVWANSTHHELLNKYLPRRFLAPKETMEEMFLGLAQGECNSISSNAFYLAEPNVRQAGYQGEYVMSSYFLTRRGLTAAIRSDDPLFLSFINAIIGALVAAESRNITKATAGQFPQTTLFGEQYQNMFRDALRLEGNYGEWYETYYESFDPRKPINRINNGTTGLLLAQPFGNTQERCESHKLGGTLQAILDRGILDCGIKHNLPGFSVAVLGTAESDYASYSGMDVDYCKAIAASLFQGDSTKVNFVEVEDARDGFVLLAGRDIDVFAGAVWNLENDVRESETGTGFTFSSPYFYGYSQEEENFSLATREDDHDWSAFVQWTVQATFYAEQEGIGFGANSIKMPEVFTFGDQLKRMFRDAILNVGNYGEMYRRNLEEFIPRAAPNLLNNSTHPGPQHYVMPGYF